MDLYRFEAPNTQQINECIHFVWSSSEALSHMAFSLSPSPCYGREQEEHHRNFSLRHFASKATLMNVHKSLTKRPEPRAQDGKRTKPHLHALLLTLNLSSPLRPAQHLPPRGWRLPCVPRAPALRLRWGARQRCSAIVATSGGHAHSSLRQSLE